MDSLQLGYGYRTTIKYCQWCGKPCYDKRSAQSAVNKRMKESGVRLRIYQCGNHWHLTHLLK